MKICLIIPCYNEASRLNLAAYTEFIEAHSRDIQLVFVNDGSSDQTNHFLQNSFSKFDNVKILDLIKNQGKACAVREGIVYALGLDTKYDYLGFWDADLATPFDQIDYFKEAIKLKKSFIVGSRINRLGSRINRKWYRHYLGRIFATCASLALGISVYDTQCGAKIFSSDICAELFNEPFSSKWIFDIEIFFRSKKLNIKKDKYYEVPLMDWKDIGGSSLRPKDFMRAPLELIYLMLRYR